MSPAPDDTVWLLDGDPGIVVGVEHRHVHVLWRNGVVTRHSIRSLYHVARFT